MKQLLFILSISLLHFLFSCGASSVEKVKTSANANDSTKTVDTTNNKGEWTYAEKEDKMNSKKMHIANLRSITELDLKFPYQGAQASIALRYKDDKLNAILWVTKGQFMPNMNNAQDIKVRFDSSKAKTYECASSSDGSPEELWIVSSKEFLEKLKHSKKVIIEAEMYQNGLQQMEFNCEGLIWNH